MIGIIAEKKEAEAVEEFFQLFKTPWEFYKDDRSYQVLLSTKDINPRLNAKLILVYGSEKKQFDAENGIALGPKKRDVVLEWNGIQFPVYNDTATFEMKGEPVVEVTGTSEAAGIQVDGVRGKILRLGYNLFREINFLLSSGQPAEYAHIPTLEIHISMLRNWILQSGIPLVEVPPVPAGYDFICCLTHDVDFVGIRNHRFDHTVFGFVYRALLGSVIGLIKRRISWGKLIKNFRAVCSLPGVYFGLMEDFWVQFGRYLEIENDLCSTFFFLPFKKRAGKGVLGKASKRRAATYDVADLERHIQSLMSNGCEIGLHGIDAWREAESGIEESDRISSVTGKRSFGVRMHWLFFNSRSPEVIEEAGFLYDSSLGYNDAVGYWGGTAQVFRPFGAKKLLELPLHIQDTALFYPNRMGLRENRALDLCKRLIKNASIHGGVLVVNWHQRSLAPERLWGDFYTRLLGCLKEQRVWFATAEQVVRWFQKRRQVTFEDAKRSGDKMRIEFGNNGKEIQPSMLIRLHRPKKTESRASTLSQSQKNYTEIPWKGEPNIEISM